MTEAINKAIDNNIISESVFSTIYRTKGDNGVNQVVKKYTDLWERSEKAKAVNTALQITELSIPGIPEYHRFTNDKGGIFTPDIGGERLRTALEICPFELDEALDISIKITRSVFELHKAQFVHCNISLDNIICNTLTDEVRLIDLDLALKATDTPLESEKLKRRNKDIHSVAPEVCHEGNPHDFITDLYSLGCVLSEIFCEALEDCAGGDKKLISSIIDKLKTHERRHRYQSAESLMKDLERCKDNFDKFERILPFKVGLERTVRDFSLPAGIYGREKETTLLFDALLRFEKGSGEIVYIEGPNDSGKTFLTNHTIRTHLNDSVLLVDTELSFRHSRTPYSTASAIVFDVIKQYINTELWNTQSILEHFVTVYGDDRYLIYANVPGLSELLGDDSVSAEITNVPQVYNGTLPTLLRQLCVDFIKHNAHKGMIIDNFHYADVESLTLLDEMIEANTEIPFMLVMLVQRGEIANKDAFGIHRRSLVAKSDKNINVTEIPLSPLLRDDISSFLASTFSRSPHECITFAETIQCKTTCKIGDVTRFIHRAGEKGDIYFDNKSKEWRWNIENIGAYDAFSSASSLFSLYCYLGECEKRVIEVCACIGVRFDINLVAGILDSNKTNIINDLESTINQGLISKNGDIVRFPEKQIQKRIYDNISEIDRRTYHLKAVDLLLDKVASDHTKPLLIFARQIKLIHRDELAIKHLQQSLENKLIVVDALFSAATILYESRDHELAYTYCKLALLYIGNNPWNDHYDRCLAVHNLSAVLCYRNANYEEMTSHTSTIISSASNQLDKIEAFQLDIQSSKAQLKKKEALEYGLNVLRSFGIRYPTKPKLPYVAMRLVFAYLTYGFRRVGTYYSARPAEDIKARAVLRVMATLGPAAYSASVYHVPLLVFSGLKYTVKYGSTAEAAFVFSSFATLLRTAGLINRSADFDELGFKLLKKYKAEEYEAQILFFRWGFIKPWKTHFKNTEEHLLKAYEKAIACQDYEYASYLSSGYFYNSFLRSKNLDIVAKEFSFNYPEIERFGHATPVYLHKMLRQTVDNLMGSTSAPTKLSGKYMHEEDHIETLTSGEDENVTYGYYYLKLMLYSMFDMHKEALTMEKEALAYRRGVAGFPVIPSFCLHAGISRIKQLQGMGAIERLKSSFRISSYLRYLNTVSKNCPDNFKHKYLLLKAVNDAFNTGKGNAIRYFEEAIKFATSSDHNHDLALSHELLAEFYVYKNDFENAKENFQISYSIYNQWGAKAKANQLKSKNSEYFGTSLMCTNKPNHAYERALQECINITANEDGFDNAMDKMLTIIQNVTYSQRTAILTHKNGDVKIKALRTTFNNDISLVEKRIEHCDPSLMEDAVLEAIDKMDVVSIAIDNPNSDQYKQQLEKGGIKSIYIFPVIKRDSCVALLYLENYQSSACYENIDRGWITYITQILYQRVEKADLEKNELLVREKFKYLRDHSDIGIWHIDSKYGLDVNEPILKMFGFDDINDFRAQFKKDNSLFWENQVEAEKFQDELDTSSHVSEHIATFRRKDGTIFWGSLSAQSGNNNFTNVDYTNGIFLDLSDVMQRKVAEDAATIIRLFVATMSHEIRTPINSLTVFSKELSNPNITDKERKQYYGIVESSRDEVVRLLNDVLDLSKVEAGKVELLKDDMLLHHLLKHICLIEGRSATEKNIRIIEPDYTEIPDKVLGDPGRIKQILVNIISNAIKHTNKGTISINVSSCEQRDKYRLNFAVTDTGVGISAEGLSQLFEPYKQVGISSRNGGTGLGSAIAKKLIESMGGAVSVSSEIGRGTTVSFHIYLDKPDVNRFRPLSALAGCSIEDTPSDDVKIFKKLRILAADDHERNRDVLSMLLRDKVGTLTIVEDGLLAVKEIESGAKYDIVLMDIRMPRMNGIDAAKRIKSIYNIPIIALTANVQQSKDSDFKFDRYVDKPIDLVDLCNAISDCTHSQRTHLENVVGCHDLMQFDGVNFNNPMIKNRWEKSLVIELIGEFDKDYGDTTTRLETLLADGDVESAITLLHTMGGVAGTFGAFRLDELTSELERDLHERKINTDLISSIAKEIKHVSTCIAVQMDNLESKKEENGSIDTSLNDLIMMLRRGDGNSVNYAVAYSKNSFSDPVKIQIDDLLNRTKKYEFNEAIIIAERIGEIIAEEEHGA